MVRHVSAGCVRAGELVAMSLVSRPSRRFGTRSAHLFWRLPLVGRVRVPRNLAPLLLAVAVGLAAGFAAVALTAAGRRPDHGLRRA